MPPTLISEAGGLSPQLAFWRDHFIAPPQGLRDHVEPSPLDPVFLALYPPADVGARIRSLAWDLRHKHRLHGWPIERDCLHISLHGICRYGELTPSILMAIGAACAKVAQPLFLAEFDEVASFDIGKTRALVLRGHEGVDGIRALHAELPDALTAVGVAPIRRQIEPHVTLLYDPLPVSETIPKLRWTVSEFRLVCSLRGRHRHLPLAHWRLPDAPG
jgi:RNA 2',3'-cyclic 3'-phosphodiesterase